jgi:hypothetical protein
MADVWAKIAYSVPRVTSVVSHATPTPNADTTDMYVITALAEAAAFGAPTGTLENGQRLILRVKDDGFARLLTWDAAYVGSDLPNTTVASGTLYVVCIYNSATSKWDTALDIQEVYGNLDSGFSNSTYGGVSPIDCGGSV